MASCWTRLLVRSAVLLLCAAVAAPYALAARPMIGAGDGHTLLLDEDGTVRAVGDNNSGQLGNNSTVNSATWVNVSGLTDVVQVVGAFGSSMALKRDGTVWTWGNNASGKLGLGDSGVGTNRLVPTQTALTNVVALAAGENFSAALFANGTVATWGANAHGQLGDGWNTVTQPTPTLVPGLTGVTAIAAGGTHMLALKSDGTLRAWGHNDQGQVGNVVDTSVSSPVTPNTIADAVKIAAGYYNSYALLANGVVMAWGINNYGCLGIGGTNPATSKVPVHVLTPSLVPLTCVTDIAAGGYYALATTCNGNVVGWGANFGGLGRGTSTTLEATAASTVPAYTDVAGVFASSSGTNSHSFIYRSTGGSGEVLAFGMNVTSSLGTPTGGTKLSPTPIAALDPGAKVGKRSNFSNTGDHTDIFWRRSDGVNVIWDYTGPSATDFTANWMVGVDPSWTAIGGGDVNGDGKADVTWFQASTGCTAIWLMSSPSTVSSAVFPACVGPRHVMAAGGRRRSRRRWPDRLRLERFGDRRTARLVHGSDRTDRAESFVRGGSFDVAGVRGRGRRWRLARRHHLVFAGERMGRGLENASGGHLHRVVPGVGGRRVRLGDAMGRRLRRRWPRRPAVAAHRRQRRRLVHERSDGRDRAVSTRRSALSVVGAGDWRLRW